MLHQPHAPTTGAVSSTGRNVSGIRMRHRRRQSLSPIRRVPPLLKQKRRTSIITHANLTRLAKAGNRISDRERRQLAAVDIQRVYRGRLDRVAFGELRRIHALYNTWTIEETFRRLKAMQRKEEESMFMDALGARRAVMSQSKKRWGRLSHAVGAAQTDKTAGQMVNAADKAVSQLTDLENGTQAALPPAGCYLQTAISEGFFLNFLRDTRLVPHSATFNDLHGLFLSHAIVLREECERERVRRLFDWYTDPLLGRVSRAQLVRLMRALNPKLSPSLHARHAAELQPGSGPLSWERFEAWWLKGKLAEDRDGDDRGDEKEEEEEEEEKKKDVGDREKQTAANTATDLSGTAPIMPVTVPSATNRVFLTEIAERDDEDDEDVDDTSSSDDDSDRDSDRDDADTNTKAGDSTSSSTADRDAATAAARRRRYSSRRRSSVGVYASDFGPPTHPNDSVFAGLTKRGFCAAIVDIVKWRSPPSEYCACGSCQRRRGRDEFSPDEQLRHEAHALRIARRDHIAIGMDQMTRNSGNAAPPRVPLRGAPSAVGNGGMGGGSGSPAGHQLMDVDVRRVLQEYEGSLQRLFCYYASRGWMRSAASQQEWDDVVASRQGMRYMDFVRLLGEFGLYPSLVTNDNDSDFELLRLLTGVVAGNRVGQSHVCVYPADPRPGTVDVSCELCGMARYVLPKDVEDEVREGFDAWLEDRDDSCDGAAEPMSTPAPAPMATSRTVDTSSIPISDVRRFLQFVGHAPPSAVCDYLLACIQRHVSSSTSTHVHLTSVTVDELLVGLTRANELVSRANAVSLYFFDFSLALVLTALTVMPRAPAVGGLRVGGLRPAVQLRRFIQAFIEPVFVTKFGRPMETYGVNQTFACVFEDLELESVDVQLEQVLHRVFRIYQAVSDANRGADRHSAKPPKPTDADTDADTAADADADTDTDTDVPSSSAASRLMPSSCLSKKQFVLYIQESRLFRRVGASDIGRLFDKHEAGQGRLDFIGFMDSHDDLYFLEWKAAHVDTGRMDVACYRLPMAMDSPITPYGQAKRSALYRLTVMYDKYQLPCRQSAPHIRRLYRRPEWKRFMDEVGTEAQAPRQASPVKGLTDTVTGQQLAVGVDHVSGGDRRSGSVTKVRRLSVMIQAMAEFVSGGVVAGPSHCVPAVRTRMFGVAATGSRSHTQAAISGMMDASVPEEDLLEAVKAEVMDKTAAATATAAAAAAAAEASSSSSPASPSPTITHSLPTSRARMDSVTSALLADLSMDTAGLAFLPRFQSVLTPKGTTVVGSLSPSTTVLGGGRPKSRPVADLLSSGAVNTMFTQAPASMHCEDLDSEEMRAAKAATGVCTTGNVGPYHQLAEMECGTPGWGVRLPPAPSPAESVISTVTAFTTTESTSSSSVSGSECGVLSEVTSEAFGPTPGPTPPSSPRKATRFTEGLKPTMSFRSEATFKDAVATLSRQSSPRSAATGLRRRASVAGLAAIVVTPSTPKASGLQSQGGGGVSNRRSSFRMNAVASGLGGLLAPPGGGGEDASRVLRLGTAGTAHNLPLTSTSNPPISSSSTAINNATTRSNINNNNNNTSKMNGSPRRPGATTTTPSSSSSSYSLTSTRRSRQSAVRKTKAICAAIIENSKLIFRRPREQAIIRQRMAHAKRAKHAAALAAYVKEATLNRDAGGYGLALMDWEKALKIATSTEDTVAVVGLLQDMAVCSIRLEYYTNALTYSEHLVSQVFRYSEATQMDKAAALSVLGGCFEAMGDPRRAADCHHRRALLCRIEGDMGEETKALIDFARAQVELNRWSEAPAPLHNALRLSLDPADLAAAHGLMGEALLHLGYLADAVESFQKERELQRRAPDTRVMLGLPARPSPQKSPTKRGTGSEFGSPLNAGLGSPLRRAGSSVSDRRRTPLMGAPLHVNAENLHRAGTPHVPSPSTSSAVSGPASTPKTTRPTTTGTTTTTTTTPVNRHQRTLRLAKLRPPPITVAEAADENRSPMVGTTAGSVTAPIPSPRRAAVLVGGGGGGLGGLGGGIAGVGGGCGGAGPSDAPAPPLNTAFFRQHAVMFGIREAPHLVAALHLADGYRAYRRFDMAKDAYEVARGLARREANRFVENLSIVGEVLAQVGLVVQNQPPASSLTMLQNALLAKRVHIQGQRPSEVVHSGVWESVLGVNYAAHPVSSGATPTPTSSTPTSALLKDADGKLRRVIWLGKHWDSEFLLAVATHALGVVQLEMGNKDDAQALLETALEVATKLDTPSIKAQCLLYLARIDLVDHRFVQAINRLNLCLTLSWKLDMLDYLQAAHGMLGRALVCLGYVGAGHAVGHLFQRLRIAREMQDRRCEGEALCDIGDCLYLLGSPWFVSVGPALSTLKRAAKGPNIRSRRLPPRTAGGKSTNTNFRRIASFRRRTRGPRSRLGAGTATLGGFTPPCVSARGPVPSASSGISHDLAKQWCSEPHPLFPTTPSLTTRPPLRQRQLLQRAADLLQLALPVFLNKGSLLRMSHRIFAALGRCFMLLSEEKLALECWRQAAKTADSLGDGVAQAEGVTHVGECLQLLACYKDAIACFKHVLETAESLKDELLQTEAHGRLEACYTAFHASMG